MPFLAISFRLPIILSFRTGRAALNLAGDRALMPLNSFGLTGSGAASKLFFLASQTACQRWTHEF